MPSSLVELLDDGEHFLHQQRRQSHARLVEQHHLGPGHHGAADRQHLLLAAREIAGEAVALAQAREVGVDEVDIAVDFLVATRIGADLEVFEHGHVGDDAPALHDLEDAAAHDLFGILVGDRLSVEGDVARDDLAVLGMQEARDRFQGRGLAGAIGAKQRDDLAFGNLQADAAQDENDIVIDDFDVFDSE